MNPVLGFLGPGFFIQGVTNWYPETHKSERHGTKTTGSGQRALCERLLAERHEVLAVDNFFIGSMVTIAHLIDDKNFALLRHDVTAPLEVKVDSIFN
jgi:UDP-glucuronate decarboxylase